MERADKRTSVPARQLSDRVLSRRAITCSWLAIFVAWLGIDNLHLIHRNGTPGTFVAAASLFIIILFGIAISMIRHVGWRFAPVRSTFVCLVFILFSIITIVVYLRKLGVVTSPSS